MEITEVRIKLAIGEGPLRAFCAIQFDGEFVVRDLKVIEGQKGMFVAMPTRRIMAKCSACATKNELRARFCNGCGATLPADSSSGPGRTRLFQDVAHPITAAYRRKIQNAVFDAFERERNLAQKPGYVCTYEDFDECAA